MIDCICHITIDDRMIFNWVADVESVSSIKSFTDTATVNLPGKVIIDKKLVKLNESGLIKKGMPIEIRLGYNYTYRLVFKGYVTDVSSQVPMVIKCEDEMWKFKTNYVKPKTFKKANLQELVKYCADVSTSLPVMANDVSVGKWVIEEDAPAINVFEELNKLYGFQFFFRDETLYAGLPYWSEYQENKIFTFGTNIFENDSLEVIDEDDQQIRLKAISILKDNTKLEIEVGDKQGAIRTWYFSGVEKKADLTKFAEEKLKELKFTGLKGSYKTFGFPQVKVGDVVELVDPLGQKRDGKYMVTKVVTQFGTNPAYMQIIHLGRKAA